MSVYTVSELAKLSGVSVRTLHHYDQIGLLRPATVGANGYRYYGPDELLRLQQVLFHRELGFPLEQIRLALDAADFDLRGALQAHRARLMAEARRYRALVETLDATLAALEGDAEMNDKTLYRGFSPEKQAEHEAWLEDRLGPGVRQEIQVGKARLADMNPAEAESVLADLEATEAAVARAMAEGLPADGEVVGDLIRRHRDWVERSWKRPPNREAYVGLAGIYRDHPDFRARYEGRAAGLTDYLVAAMTAFAARELA